jgi:D-lactate dehydrogenase (cytochrome)
MASSSALHARAPRGPRGSAPFTTDPDVVAAHLTDAANYSGGHAPGIATPDSETAVADVLHRSSSVLPIGAQSSLTGGATPMGDVLLSTARLKRLEVVRSDQVRVGAGVTLLELDAALERSGHYYPPVPTFLGAFVGGAVATNAAGASTFKYGTTRTWVEALTVVLADGDVLDIERGRTAADAAGEFRLFLRRGEVRLRVPAYRMPPLPKLAAGYYAAPRMDLIDLFIGSEGTLGVVTEVTLRILARRPAVCFALVPFTDRQAALTFARALRVASVNTWRFGDERGLDVAAIEYMDARSLSLIRQDGIDRAQGVAVPDTAVTALLVALELAPGTTPAQAYDELGRAHDRDGPDTPLTRFCALLSEAGVLDDVEFAAPGDKARAAQLLAIREAVPAAVNQRVGRAKAAVDARIEKTAADMIVPFEHIAALLDSYDDLLRRRGLDAAVWGHLSDGNVHPNILPRTYADMESGRAAILELGREVIRLGGAPLAEHGVGRNPVKQELLRQLYGDRGIEEMRRVKRALDPQWKLAPGVIFPP